MGKTEQLREFYKDKTVYITGITGFKGTWLAIMLKELGAKVYGIGLLPEECSLSNLIDLESKVNVAYGDITAPATNSAFVETLHYSNPDLVFHLAAQPLVSEGYLEPFDTFNTNIIGTVITHEILRGLDKEKISLVNVTTDKVYLESSGSCKEEDILRGKDPYSLSKSCSDMITTCYRECIPSNVISSTMRAGNVIGGGDFSKNRIIPDIIKAVMMNSELELRNPNSTRPYQHVFDVLTAYITLGMNQYVNPKLAGEYNVGPNENGAIKTIDLVNEMKKSLEIKVNFKGKSIGHENPCLMLDSSLIKEATNWTPIYNSLEEITHETAIWYKDALSGKDCYELLKNQINGGLEKYE